MHQTNGEWTMKSNRGPEAMTAPPNYQTDSGYYKSRDTSNAYDWAKKSGSSAGGVGGSWASATPSIASQARQPSYAEQHQATPSITVTGGGAPTNTSGSGGTAVAAPIDVRYTVERINSVDYVTADQFQRGMQQAAAQGATQGEQRALTTLRQNTSQRRRVGL